MVLHQLLHIGLSPHQCLDTGQSLRSPTEGWRALVGSTRRSPSVSITEEYIPGLQGEIGEKLVKTFKQILQLVKYYYMC